MRAAWGAALTKIVATVEYRTAGLPDGPTVYVDELGESTPTFTVKPTNPKLNPCLSHHVPLDKRGPFRPTDLANHEPEREYRTDAMGFLLCYAKVTADGGERRCRSRAINRWPRCHAHGGRLHPLDKAERVNPKDVGADEFTGMTRYQQFRCGMITIHDLDDEEIANHGFRTRSGKFYKPATMPREMLQAFAEQVYERATLELRSGVRDAARLIVQLINDPTVEDALRLKAAETLLDRTMGKAPQTIRLEHQAPWEAIFEAIGGGSREESRRRRGIASDRADGEPGPLEVEATEIYTDTLALEAGEESAEDFQF